MAIFELCNGLHNLSASTLPRFGPLVAFASPSIIAKLSTTDADMHKVVGAFCRYSSTASRAQVSKEFKCEDVFDSLLS